jgi:hypothetical protein
MALAPEKFLRALILAGAERAWLFALDGRNSMKTLRRYLLSALLGGVVASGCSCPVAFSGSPDASTGNDAGQDAGRDAGTSDGGGTGYLVAPTDPLDPQNATKDSDCDGLTDAEEFAVVYAGGKKTDPGNPDTDLDGIRDGVELGRTTSVVKTCGFAADANPASTTLPTESDSDLDGVSDGVEDANQNGAIDLAELDPNNPDTDGDRLSDGTEDANHNGVVDSGEPNPRMRDTDGDGIADGTEISTTHTSPTRADTDGDTCTDAVEDSNQNGTTEVGETDPNDGSDCGNRNLPDTDSDGIPDVIEDANGNMAWDQGSESNFQSADTDGDALGDGLEDRNHDGVVGAGETNPRRKDSDCDGLLDGPRQGTALGEDLNGNGVVDAGETDPTKVDTDGDGIGDGVERGITAPADPLGCGSVPVDANPSTTTDPTRSDTDGDGIPDGAEDSNQDGCVSCGGSAELNPNDSSDGTGPAGQVCTVNNLKPVLFKEDGTPDIQLGLPATYSEFATVTVNGASKGMMGFDPTNKVAFLAYRTTPPAANVTADEVAIRGTLNGVSTLSSPITQPFPTAWDGHPAIQAFYDQSGTADLKARANALAAALVPGSSGRLALTAGVSGPFRIQAQYVRRSSQTLIVLVAIAPISGGTLATPFTLADTAGGSALAQFGDATAVQCETFRPGSGKVDFLFVVDDSGSMADSQTALGDAAAAMATALGASTLDYRIAMVSSDYHITSGTGPNRNGVLRGWTTDLNQFKAWLTQNSTCSGGVCSGTGATPAPACNPTGANGGCWIGTSGSGAEGVLGAARKATNDLTAPGSANPVRAGAELVIILLGDADDQTSGYTTTANKTNLPSATLEGVQNFINFFMSTGPVGQSTKNTLNKIIPVHGIVCPAGTNCNSEWQENPQRHAQVINATSGIRGDITTTASIQATINAIVDNAIAASGYKTQKPAIGASVKVAVDSVLDSPNPCNENDLPRSRIDGFDFNGLTGTISFFGSCRPSSTSQKAAVSYRYWVDTTPNPNGNPPPCSTDTQFYDATQADYCRGKLVCNRTTNLCECPADCGGTPPPGMTCNSNRLVCDFQCAPDCGGTCSGYQTCDQNSCGCRCLQNASCAPGYAFVNNGTQCGCFCNTAALNCGPTYQADPNACACVCKPDCGGCAGGSCNISMCTCDGIVN